MKATIRRGMFETNSSSMHSIILSQDNVPDINPNREDNTKETDWRDKPYVFHIRWGYKDEDSMSFSRGEPRVYYTPLPKAKVLVLLYAYNLFSKVDYMSEEDYMEKMNPFCQKLEDLIWDHEGLRVTIDIPPTYETTYDNKKYTYINVDSEGLDTLYELLDYVKDDDNLSRYLFDNKSIVILGGDEYPEVGKVQHLVTLSNYPRVIIGDFNPDNGKYSLFDWHFKE